ncbi:hypothetical protein GCM10023166_07280 [Paeniglutamicibacter cryotolerans]
MLTTTSLTDGVASADPMARAKSVLPPILLRFFSGTPLDPPRAGITTRVCGASFVLTRRTLRSDSNVLATGG